MEVYEYIPLTTFASNSKNKMSSSFSYENEITNSFRIFDVERNGTISSNDLKLMLRALGFRVTKHEVMRDVLESYQKRGIFQQQKKNSGKDEDVIKEIDLETVLDIMLDPGSKYNRSSQNEQEMKKRERLDFRLFDVENKGYITVSNLKRAVQDLKDCKEEILGKEYTSLLEGMDDNELKAMIEEFDGDQDGMISEDEFRQIMGHSL